MNIKTVKKCLAFASILLSPITFTQVAYASSLQVSSWNIAWLSETGYPQFSESIRNKDDWQRLSYYSDKLNSDVLAFQEVNSIEAISKVVGDNFNIYLSQRSGWRYRDNQFDDINQYTGFAVNKSLEVKEHKDLNLNTERNGKLRFATYIEVKRPNAAAIHAYQCTLKRVAKLKKETTAPVRSFVLKGKCLIVG
ncbi:metal-dependent hydrolase [Vibrio ishigakensis]|uniref:Metal-dependent hydrolase n=1 Tax=Vibrio ishigakensis TaxID=1481914 RepID=A0A0B8PAC1_9VIBR|nr:metal-dependent hydrolase [Vibrio ishigakensis]